MQPTALPTTSYLEFLEIKIKQLEESATRSEYQLLDDDDHADAVPRWNSLRMQREQLLVLKKLKAREISGKLAN